MYEYTWEKTDITQSNVRTLKKKRKQNYSGDLGGTIATKLSNGNRTVEKNDDTAVRTHGMMDGLRLNVVNVACTATRVTGMVVTRWKVAVDGRGRTRFGGDARLLPAAAAAPLVAIGIRIYIVTTATV